MSWVINGSAHCNNIRSPESFTLTHFSDHALSAFQKTITKCLQSEQALLPIFIDSPGGAVDNMCGILSLIDYGRERGLKFSTVVYSRAASAGAMIWSYGDENLRFIGNTGKLMFHSMGTMSIGKVPELKNTIDAHFLEQDVIFEKICKNLKKPKNWLKKNLEKRKDYDWVLSADDVVTEKIGLKYSPTFVLRVEENFAIL